jgi:hypothetical protein
MAIIEREYFHLKSYFPGPPLLPNIAVPARSWVVVIDHNTIHKAG